MPTSTSRTVLGTAALAPLLILAACSPGGEDPPMTEAPAVSVPPPPGTGAGTTTSPGTPTDGDDAPDTGADDHPDDPSGEEADGATAASDEAVEITLAATGDVLAHSWVNVSARLYAGSQNRSLYPVQGEPYDYSPMFADIAGLISGADLALCHLETPLSLDNTNLSIPDTLSFNTPRELADALLGAGYDGCDFASNHTMDRGIRGVAETEQVLREVGLGYAGPTAHEERAGLAEMYDVQAADGTARVAHLAYTYSYPNSGAPTTTIPGEAPWLVASSWPSIGSAGIQEQAEAARAQGADFVVVSMHWGNEYQAEPTGDQRQIAQDLLGTDAVDLILGTHVHVIQPCEQINGKHVIYGLGNSLSNQSPVTASSLRPETQEGMVALFTLTRDEEGVVTTSMRYQPTRVEIPPQIAPGHIIRLVSPQTYPDAWERTVAAVDLLGGCGAVPVDPAS